ncbi:hypothetical protein BN1088_1432837 [Sphingobacterium sp. PM2-P1-29]|nr:hypothetical protein BN1088_1432837 [Sphingobacterium sp. PM2-P1-29]
MYNTAKKKTDKSIPLRIIARNSYLSIIKIIKCDLFEYNKH